MLLLAQITPLADFSRVAYYWIFFSVHFVITLHSSIAATSASQYKKNKTKLNKMLSTLVMSCNFMSCIFMSCNFMPCNFDGPSFLCPSFLAPPSSHRMQWCHRNEFVCGGHTSGKIVVPHHFFVLQIRLVVLVSAFVTASTVTDHSRCPMRSRLFPPCGMESAPLTEYHR